MKVKIKNVKVVSGDTLSPYWKSYMQVVTTDKGKYIDNAVDSDYEMGHDWEEEIWGYVNFKINNNKGHKWINYKGKAQTTTYTDKEWDSTFNTNASDTDNDESMGWQGYIFWAILILTSIIVFSK